jgi:hydrogenase-4 component F
VLRVLQIFHGRDTSRAARAAGHGCLSLTVAAVQVMAAQLQAADRLRLRQPSAIATGCRWAGRLGVLLYGSARPSEGAAVPHRYRLRAVYGTNESGALAGVIRVLPFSGLLFAVAPSRCCFPPFGSFMAEMLILSGIVQAGQLIAFTLMHDVDHHLSPPAARCSRCCGRARAAPPPVREAASPPRSSWASC